MFSLRACEHLISKIAFIKTFKPPLQATRTKLLLLKSLKPSMPKSFNSSFSTSLKAIKELQMALGKVFGETSNHLLISLQASILSGFLPSTSKDRIKKCSI